MPLVGSLVALLLYIFLVPDSKGWVTKLEQQFGNEFLYENRGDQTRLQLIKTNLAKPNLAKPNLVEANLATAAAVDTALPHSALPHSAIPHILHTVWLEKQLPVAIQNAIASWKNLNPTWTLHVWRKEQVLKSVPEIMTLFPKAMKTALARDVAAATLLEKYGGVYFDAEVEALQPLEPLLKADFICGVEPPLLKPYKSNRLHFTPIVVGTRPHSPIVRQWKSRLIKSIQEYQPEALQKLRVQKKITITAFGESVDWGLKRGKERCIIYGPEVFCPVNSAHIDTFSAIVQCESNEGKFRSLISHALRGDLPPYMFPTHLSCAYHLQGGRFGAARQEEPFAQSP